VASDDGKRRTEGGARPWWRRFRELPNDSALKTLVVTLAVALVGSVLVAGSAVLLRPLQIANKEAERREHFAELVRQLPEIAELVRQLPGLDGGVAAPEAVEVAAKIVDLETGGYAPSLEPRLYDQRRAARDPELSVEVPPELDVAGLKARARYAVVYLVRQAGDIRMVVLPVRGRGYGSMLYGYLALAGDTKTVVGLSFYEHAETPGLGALVDSPSWKAQWRGKTVRDEAGVVRLGVGTGRISADSPEAPYQVDGLTGATWTANGVTHLLHYWLGEHGFGPYLRKIARRRG
jgi:Na+-transporting NADH:ubiquinone oxidoreductase subunit C